MSELTPQRFYSQYVAARRPVVITGYLDSPEHAGSLSRWADPAYLRSKAGDTEVRSPRRTLLSPDVPDAKSMSVGFPNPDPGLEPPTALLCVDLSQI